MTTADTSPKTTTIDRYGQMLLRNRWLVILATLVSVSFLAYGVRFLTYESGTRIFFSKDNPQLLALEALENTYSKSDNLIFVIAPEDGNVFTHATLTAIEDLTEAAWQIPFSSRIDSITNYHHVEVDGDDLLVTPLVENAGSLTAADIERIRDTALGYPDLVDRVVASDGAVTAVMVIENIPLEDTEALSRIVAYARELVLDFQKKYHDIDLYLTGTVMLENEFNEAPLQDMKVLIPLMFLSMLLIMVISLRSLWCIVGTFLVILMSAASALGAAGWLGVVLNPSSLTAPMIIMTVTVADCVHVISTMQLVRRDGMSSDQAIIESLRINMSPVFITSITTAIAFMSLNFSVAPPFRVLGSVSAIGVILACILSLTFLPAFLAVTPRERLRAGQAYSRLIMEQFFGLMIANRSLAFWTAVTSAVVLTLGITRITLNDDFVKYFDEESPARVASEFLMSNLTGIHTMEYSMSADSEGAINDPAYLADLEKVSEWFRAQPEVMHVSTFSNIMKQLNQNMNGGDPAYYRLPDDKEASAQYLLLYEMSLPFGFDLNNQINVAKSATKLIVSLNDMSSAEMREMDERAQAWLSTNVPSLQGPATGQSISSAYLSKHNIKAMLLGGAISLVLISFILIFVFRSLTIGLLSLVPNLLPAAMAFGLWGYINGEVGLGIAIVLAMTLGIVVDDTVHFLSKYLHARREHGMGASMACQFAFSTVGPALWVTTLTLVLGFGILGLSEFKVNSDMGSLSAITMMMALFTDFFLLPTILIRFDTKST